MTKIKHQYRRNKVYKVTNTICTGVKVLPNKTLSTLNITQFPNHRVYR